MFIGDSSPGGVKQQKGKADHPPPSDTEVKNPSTYTSNAL